MAEVAHSVRLELRSLPGDYSISVRWRTVVCSLTWDGGAHRFRFLGVDNPVPFLGELPEPHDRDRYEPSGFRVIDLNAVDGGQREVDRFSVSAWIYDTYSGYWTDEVLAEAVEYLGPDDVLPRRWPDRAEVWKHARLPLDYGS